jgi:CRISPR-associated protein Cmr4
LTDARVLAFPVRSLRGVFAWVTCPAALERLGRDLQLGGLAPIQSAPALTADQAACAEASPLLAEGNKLVLEEFEFTRVADARDAADWIAACAVNDAATAARLKTHLAVLCDDDFTHFVRHATEIVTRVGLDYQRKTIKPGALFYQEFLPAETLFYSVVLARGSRREGDARPAAEVLAYLQRNIDHAGALQVGGDETTGKGLCLVRLCRVQPGGTPSK